MASKVWIVLKARYTEEDNWRIVCGVYDNFEDALERVNEVFFDSEEQYIENYGSGFDSCNHNNGFAELHVDDGWDETRIIATEYEINKPIYDGDTI